jgi:hypothetical protein
MQCCHQSSHASCSSHPLAASTQKKTKNDPMYVVGVLAAWLLAKKKSEVIKCKEPQHTHHRTTTNKQQI